MFIPDWRQTRIKGKHKTFFEIFRKKVKSKEFHTGMDRKFSDLNVVGSGKEHSLDEANIIKIGKKYSPATGTATRSGENMSHF